MIQVNNNIKLSGHFTIQVFNQDGKLKDTFEFQNMITDAGLNRLATGSAFNGCALGDGTTPPVPSNTGLQRFKNYTTTIVESTNAMQTSILPFYGLSRKKYRFAAGSLSGKYSEVGVGWTSSNMFSRSLIKDSNGDATIITVLSNEYMDVTYEVRSYMQLEDQVSIVKIMKQINAVNVYTDYTLVKRPIYLTSVGSNTSSNVGWTPLDGTNSLGGSCGALRSNAAFYATDIDTLLPFTTPSIPSENLKPDPYTVTNLSYVNNSLQRRFRVQYPLYEDVSTFRHFVIEIGMCGCYQFLFEQPIFKLPDELFTLEFVTTWGRY